MRAHLVQACTSEISVLKVKSLLEGFFIKAGSIGKSGFFDALACLNARVYFLGGSRQACCRKDDEKKENC
jgi:hypothetical protein